MELDLASSIRANTAAVQELTAALKAFNTQVILPAAQPEIAKAPLQAAEPPKPLTFDDVKPLVFEVAQLNREGLIKVLGMMGVKKAVDVAPANLPTFKKHLERLKAAA